MYLLFQLLQLEYNKYFAIIKYIQAIKGERLMKINKQIYKKHPKNFLEAYKNEIAPKLKEIDILLKSSEYPLAVEEVSKVLCITEKEVLSIMCDENINEINKLTFFQIMAKGNSYICKLFSRELECGSPYFYSVEDIAYIYNIDKKLIDNACNFLGISKITSNILPLIFVQIPL